MSEGNVNVGRGHIRRFQDPMETGPRRIPTNWATDWIVTTVRRGGLGTPEHPTFSQVPKRPGRRSEGAQKLGTGQMFNGVRNFGDTTFSRVNNPEQSPRTGRYRRPPLGPRRNSNQQSVDLSPGFYSRGRSLSKHRCHGPSSRTRRSNVLADAQELGTGQMSAI
jgi:hypothetical protein